MVGSNPNIPTTQKVDLYFFSDFHRHLKPLQDGSGGASRLAALIKHEKLSHPDSIVVNVGDVAGDNARPGQDAFDPLADVFNTMEVDILSLGNHEFEDPQGDYASLRHGLIEPFRGDVLCANVTDSLTGKPIEGTKPYTIKQLAQLNVAFIGVVTTNLALANFPTAGAMLQVVPIEATLQHMVQEVKHAGADVVVVLAHEGLKEMQRIAANTKGIDVIVAAHDHNATPQPIFIPDREGKEVAIVESGGYGKYLGHITFSRDSEGMKHVEGSLIPVTPSIPADHEVQQIVDSYKGPHRIETPPRHKKWQKIKDFKALAEHWSSLAASTKSSLPSSKTSYPGDTI